jgi:hypothetical protein
VRRENYDIPTRCLRGSRSSSELPAHGASEENRTPVLSLEDYCSAIELHSRAPSPDRTEEPLGLQPSALT